MRTNKAILFLNLILGLSLLSGCAKEEEEASSAATRCTAPQALASASSNGAQMTFCDPFSGTGTLTDNSNWSLMQ